MIEAPGVAHATRAMREYAAVGLVKSYALVLETVEVSGAKTAVRGCTIPMIRSGALSTSVSVMTCGWAAPARLAATELIGGAGRHHHRHGFNKGDLQRLINHHCGAAPKFSAPAKQRLSPDASTIPSGAILATMKQTQAARGLGRTKVNELPTADWLRRGWRV